MLPKFRGPYIISKVLEADRCLVTDTSMTQITQKPFSAVYQAKCLKKWVTEGDLQRLNSLVGIEDVTMITLSILGGSVTRWPGLDNKNQ
uniref:Uncharacterized protein n=1 Tax=Lutzomyia longipalpis TaxID=7200 RepID=A0A1B0CSH7_LUTLO